MSSSPDNDIDRNTIIYSGVGRDDPNYVEYTQEQLQVTQAEEESLTCGYGYIFSSLRFLVAITYVVHIVEFGLV